MGRPTWVVGLPRLLFGWSLHSLLGRGFGDLLGGNLISLGLERIVNLHLIEELAMAGAVEMGEHIVDNV